MSKFKYALAAVLMVLLTSALPAWADYTWKTDVEGDFTDVNNWDRGPDDPELTTIDINTLGNFVIDSGKVNFNLRQINYANVTVSGGAVYVPSDYFYLYGSLTVSGGTVYAKCLQLSIVNPTVSGSLTVSGGTVNTAQIKNYEAYLYMSGGTLNISKDGRFYGYAARPFSITGGTFGTCDLHDIFATVPDYDYDRDDEGWFTAAANSGTIDFMKSVPNSNTLTFAPESGTRITLTHSQTGSGNLVKDGEGTLILSAAPTYTGSTTITNGTLQLGADSTLYNLSGGTEDNLVTLNAAGKNLTINTSGDEAKKYVGSITAANITVNDTDDITVNATEDAPFQVYTAANGAVRAESFVVSSGRVDVKGCMEGVIDGEGIDVTVDGGVFSPGNSVGTVEVTGDVAITSNGIALFEFSSYSEGKHDELIINGDGTFTAAASTIQLYFESDISDWATEGSKYKLVSNGGFTEDYDYSSWLYNYGDLFELKGGSDGLYLISTKVAPDPNAVPEPSTWALLILGAAGLMYVRKRTRK